MGGRDEGQFHQCLAFLWILCCQTHGPVCVSGMFSSSQAVKLLLICLSFPDRQGRGLLKNGHDMGMCQHWE